MAKKVWEKPVIKTIRAGSAEGGTKNGTDRTNGNPNKS